MPDTSPNRRNSLPDYIGLFAAIVLFSWCITGWLTNSVFSGAVWPPDVNGAVIRLLGGNVSLNAVGKPLFELSITAVMIRLIGFVVMACLITRAASRRLPDKSTVILPLIRQTTVAFLASASWWLFWLPGEFGWQWPAAVASGILPLWIGVTLGSVSWIWLRPILIWPRLGLSERTCRRISIGLLLSAMIAWVGVSYWMNFCLYEQLFIPHGDSAMYEEHLWNVWHGKGFRSYLDQGLFLGEHFQVIHLLLIPFHMLWPSHLLLELTESIALGSCAIPIYLIARRHSHSKSAAGLLAVAWLFYFPMHFLDIAIDQKSFRPIALGIPFLFWMIEFAERRHIRGTAICLILALSAKEDVALVTFPLLAVLAVVTKTSAQRTDDVGQAAASNTASSGVARWFWALAVCSALYLLFVVLFGIPFFRSGEAVHYSRYFGDLGNSPGELVKTALTEPHRVILKLLGARTFIYATVFLAPLAFLPLRKWGLLIAALPSFIMLSLMELGDTNTGLPPVPYHHFHAPLLPVFFWAAAVALGSTPKEPDQTSKWRLRFPAGTTASELSLLILMCCLATSLTGSLMPCGVTFWSNESAFGVRQLYLPDDPRQQERARMARVVTDQIPMSARVASTDFIHTRLTHHERSYDYSDYVRKVNNYERGVPADTEFIVIDTGHRYSRIKSPKDVPELQQSESPWQLQPDKTNGHFIILRRTSTAE